MIKRKEALSRGAVPLTKPMLPHERDEAVQPAAQVQPVMVQAADDVVGGMVDTDNYTRATAVANALSSERLKKSKPA